VLRSWRSQHTPDWVSSPCGLRTAGGGWVDDGIVHCSSGDAALIGSAGPLLVCLGATLPERSNACSTAAVGLALKFWHGQHAS
jgi:hypothetical protein